MTISPPPLKKGDAVAVIATARKILPDEISQALQSLQNWGLQVMCGKNLYKSNHQFAGTDQERLDDLQWALDNEQIKAIFVARGGYGTIRIIDHADFSGFVKNPKWLVGYSDVTLLHAALYKHGFQSIHGPMPINLHTHEEAGEALRKILVGYRDPITAGPMPLNRSGESEGELIGGNLSLVFANSASRFDFNTKDNILFLEDLDEYLYHIDRMMLQLKRSGKLSLLKGMIVGGMTEMKDNAIPFGKTAEEIIWNAVEEYDFPVCFGFPAGHIDRNLSFVHGARVKLTINQGGSTLTYL